MGDRGVSEQDSDISVGSNGGERHLSPGKRLTDQLDRELLSARRTAQDPRDPQENDFENHSVSALQSSKTLLERSTNVPEQDLAERLRSFARTLPAEFWDQNFRRSVSRDSSSSSSGSSSDSSCRSRSKSYHKSRNSSKKKSHYSSKRKSRKSRKHDARSPTRHRSRSARAGDPSRGDKGSRPSAGSTGTMRTEPIEVHRSLGFLPNASNRHRVGSPSVERRTNTGASPKRPRDTVSSLTKHAFASGLSLSASFASELPGHGQRSAPPSASRFPLTFTVFYGRSPAVVYRC